MGVVVRALREDQRRRADGNPDLLSANFTFLNSSVGGEACEVVVRVLKAGRLVTTLQADLEQRGKVRVQCTAMFGKFGDGPTRKAQPGPADVPRSGVRPPSEEELAASEADPPLREQPTKQVLERFRWWFMSDTDLRAYQHMLSVRDWSGPGAAPTGYRCLASLEHADEALSVEALACLVDVNVPCIFGVLPREQRTWAPTLAFDLQFFAPVPDGARWVHADYQLHAHGPTRFTADCELADPRTGAVLAVARQSALFGVQQRAPAPRL